MGDSRLDVNPVDRLSNDPNYVTIVVFIQFSLGYSARPMIKVLELRKQYRSCHIRLPGDDHRFPAVMVDDKFYSLLKVVNNRQKTLEICALLASKSKDVVVTKVAKGDAIWVWEADAIVEATTKKHLRSVPVAAKSLPCRILESSDHYQQCYIRIPDFNDRLEAIYLGGSYFGLFKVVETHEQALDLATKLKNRGDEVVITITPQQEAIWVLEPEAFLA